MTKWIELKNKHPGLKKAPCEFDLEQQNLELKSRKWSQWGFFRPLTLADTMNVNLRQITLSLLLIPFTCQCSSLSPVDAHTFHLSTIFKARVEMRPPYPYSAFTYLMFTCSLKMETKSVLRLRVMWTKGGTRINITVLLRSRLPQVMTKVLFTL